MPTQPVSATPTPFPVTPTAVQQLIVAAFSHLHPTNLRPFGSGWSNSVWLTDTTGGPLLFRFPKTLGAAARAQMELPLLPALRRAPLPLPVPDYRHVAPAGVAAFPHPFGGYRPLPGRPLSETDVRLTPSAVRTIGAFINALQAVPTAVAADCGVPGASPAAWRQEYTDWYAETRPLIAPALTAPELAWVDRSLAAFLGDDRHFRFAPALLHRDLGPDHLLVDPASGAVTGVIDFEDAFIGDPAFEFTGVLRFGPDVLTDYAGEIDPTFHRRIGFYQWLVPVHELRYGCESELPAHVAAGLTGMRANGPWQG